MDEQRSVPEPDPSRHLSQDELLRRLSELAPAKRESGRVVLLVTRPDGDQRATPKRAHLSAAGDALRVVSKRATTRPNLRGIHLRVIEDGDVCVGDAVQVIRG